MDINDIFPEGLDFSTAYDLLEPVVIYILGMAVYALFIFNFYQFVASRDIFAFDLSKYENARFKAARVFIHVVLYALQYLFIFPVVAFFWFGAITIMLSFLAADQEFSDILLIAMAVVGTIRICSYLTEDLSRDLAKMLPFGVLAFVIINLSSSIPRILWMSSNRLTIAGNRYFITLSSPSHWNLPSGSSKQCFRRSRRHSQALSKPPQKHFQFGH